MIPHLVTIISILFSIELLLIEENQSLFNTSENIGRKKKYHEFQEINKKYIDTNIITGIEEKLKKNNLLINTIT